MSVKSEFLKMLCLPMRQVASRIGATDRVRGSLILLLPAFVATLGLVACSKQQETVLRFEASPASTAKSQIRDLRFYVHDIVLLDAAGTPHPLHLTVSPTQSVTLALVDLRNRQEGAVRGQTDSGPYIGVRFTVGVPFESNHGNPLTAGPPLDLGDLFWAWQSGYKFLRVDGAQDGKEWSFHLGSTGCSSLSALRPPSKQCAQPNRMRVELRGFDPLQKPVVVNVAELLAVMGTATQRACTGDYTGAECSAAYALTGLDPMTGQCANNLCRTQTLFGVGAQ